MAKFSIDIDVSKDEVTKVLTLFGHEYKEVWTDNCFCCEHPMTELIYHDHPNISKSIMEIITTLSNGELYDIVDAMHELQEYEASMIHDVEDNFN